MSQTWNLAKDGKQEQILYNTIYTTSKSGKFLYINFGLAKPLCDDGNCHICCFMESGTMHRRKEASGNSGHVPPLHVDGS